MERTIIRDGFFITGRGGYKTTGGGVKFYPDKRGGGKGFSKSNI